LIALMMASEARTQTWLTTFEIMVGIRPRPSELRWGRDPQRGSADG
jgi:hypothetical protein